MAFSTRLFNPIGLRDLRKQVAELQRVLGKKTLVCEHRRSDR